MRANPVKRALRDGGTAVGTFVFEFATTGIARLAAGAGAEFVVFDLEHTGWSMETLRGVLAGAAPPLVPVVRVPATEYHFIARALDVGAMGVMVPMVESADQARRVVAAAKYPPAGRRGAAFGVAHDDYRGGDILATMAAANAEGLLIAQIETAAGVREAEAVAAVDGIDVLWVGHFDLTNSMGIPGQFDHPDFLRAVRDVAAAAQRHGKAAGFMCTDVAGGRALLEQGYRALAYGGDLWLYQQALRAGVAGLKGTA
ncbi:MAG TPA: aldolase/citrate lyase family protein [Urbifossiella sp.]|nr:aldolase/citrate lyase family protein [Urbifossiella sp.]